jgi:putative tricarboxylic transport membrane protein
MLIFGMLGFLMRRGGFEGAPFILAMVLGPIMETSLRQSLLISRGSFSALFSRPIFAVLTILSVAFLISPLSSARIKSVVESGALG